MAKKNNTIPSLFNDLNLAEYDPIEVICQKLGCTYGTPAWPDKFGEALNKYVIENNFPKIRTLSLFSGAGGLDIGFHDLGFEIIESVEIESKFCDTLFLNSGEGKKFASSKPNCIDIREYTGDGLGEIDFIIGGPPCQTFSAAGRRHGGVLGTTDDRGVLFREYVRLLKKLKPKGFLFENVYGIIGAQNGEAWEEIKRSFSEVGYKLHYRILDAADYGVPQHRERLIIVGLRNGNFDFPRPISGPDSLNETPFYNAGTAVSGLTLTAEEKAIGISGRFGKLINDIPPGLNYSFYTKELGHPNAIFAWRSKFSDFMYKADPETPVRTIKAQGGQYTGPLHWDTRYFAYSEFKRLQTFPDDYAISGVKQVAVHQIGNSVPPQLARMLALAIRIQVFKTDFPFNLELIPETVTLSFRKKKRELSARYQQKAKDAIAKLYDQTPKFKLENRSFFLTLTDKFKYIESNESGEYKVKVCWKDNQLSIEVYPTDKPKSSLTKVIITPTETWSLPIDNVTLKIYTSNWHGVTAGWKVFDRILVDNHFKADLVQLNGYYQYPSQLQILLNTKSLDSANIIKTIYDGKITGSTISNEDLAKAFDIPETDLLETAKWLRKLGYEIRNTHTNPQIPEDTWLIPYKFPTLLPESVQLNKTLE